MPERTVIVFLVIRAPGCVFRAAVHYNSTEAIVFLPVLSLMLAAACLLMMVLMVMMMMLISNWCHDRCSVRLNV